MISILIIPRTRVDCPPPVVVVLVEEFLLSFPNCFSPSYQRVGSFLLFSIYINRALASPRPSHLFFIQVQRIFFSRSVPVSLSHHLCSPFPVLPFSDICSSPSTALFRTLLRFTCSATRPIVPSRSDPFQDLRSVQWLLQAVSLYRRKTQRESMYVRMKNIGQRGSTSKMFLQAM